MMIIRKVEGTIILDWKEISALVKGWQSQPNEPVLIEYQQSIEENPAFSAI